MYIRNRGPLNIYTGIPQVLLCMPYLLRYGDIEFGSHFDKWPSQRYAQFLKFPPSRILKPYVYISQINSQTFLSTKCLRAYRAGPGLDRAFLNRRLRVRYGCALTSAGNACPSMVCSDPTESVLPKCRLISVIRNSYDIGPPLMLTGRLRGSSSRNLTSCPVFFRVPLT